MKKLIVLLVLPLLFFNCTDDDYIEPEEEIVLRNNHSVYTGFELFNLRTESPSYSEIRFTEEAKSFKLINNSIDEFVDCSNTLSKDQEIIIDECNSSIYFYPLNKIDYNWEIIITLTDNSISSQKIEYFYELN